MIDAPIGVDPHLLLQLIELEEQERLKEAAKTDYLSYCTYVHEGEFEHTRQAVVICNAINDAVIESERIMARVDAGEDVSDEGVIVLLISMPPQHGKSRGVAETLPSYFMGRNPNKNTLLISYNQNSARRFGRRNRYKVERFSTDLFNESLDNSNSSVEEFALTDGKGMIKSVGINGTITGYTGHLVIVDDPYKNGQEANSPVIRGSIQQTFEDSVQTRSHPGTLIIVVHTRWHEDDLIAYCKGFYGERAKVISIPAECESEDTDPIGRKVGEFLWVKHHGVQYYLDRKRNGRIWSAMFQQRPAPAEGALFVKSGFRSYSKSMFFLPNGLIDWSKFRYLVMSWDCTFEGATTSDYVVGHIYGWINGDYFLLHRRKKQMDFIDSHEQILSTINQFPAVRDKLIERKANGHAIIQTLERKNGVRGIISVSPTESKEVRASKVAYIINGGHVYLPDDDPTIGEMIDECGNFPFGKRDDEVDVLTQAITHIEEQINGRGRFFIGRV